MQARFGPLNQDCETLAVADIGPDTVLVTPPATDSGQLGHAHQHLAPAHRLEVAEVGFRGGVERLDDGVALGGNLVG